MKSSLLLGVLDLFQSSCPTCAGIIGFADHIGTNWEVQTPGRELQADRRMDVFWERQC